MADLGLAKVEDLVSVQSSEIVTVCIFLLFSVTLLFVDIQHLPLPFSYFHAPKQSANHRKMGEAPFPDLVAKGYLYKME